MRKNKILLVAIAFVFSVACMAKETSSKESFIAEQDALRISEDEFVKIYGKKVLQERPFRARLDKGVWKISGTLHCPGEGGCLGGIAEAEVDAKTGKIINVIHGR